MSSEENQPLEKSRLKGPLIIIGAAVAAVVIGGALGTMSSTHPKAGATNGPAETTAVVPRTAAESVSDSSVKEIAPESLSLGSDKAELKQQLRAKLAVSLEDCLKSLYELGKTQPALAIDLADELGRTDQEKMDWVKNVMQIWADADPQKAWQWLTQQSFKRGNELGGGELPSVVFGAMATRDPNMVISNVDSLLRMGNSSESISTPVALHMGMQALVDHGDLELARNAVDTWARDPRKFELGEAPISTVAMAWGQKAPTETGDWLKALPASEDRNTAMASLASVWAEREPVAALKWAETLSPSEGQQQVISRALSDAVESHPNEVAAWLGDYLAKAPINSDSDRMIQTVISNSPLLAGDPQLAFKWAELIGNPQQKETTENRAVLRWAQQDQAAAIDFVQKNSTLTQQRKQTLIQKIQSGESSTITE